MKLRNLLSRLNPFDTSRTIYLNADGTILTVPPRVQEEKELTREQTVGKYYSNLYSASHEDHHYYAELLEIASSRGSACREILVSGRRDSRKLRLSVVRGEEGEILGYTMKEQ